MMYRAFTWQVLERGIDPEDEKAVGRMARQVSMTASTTADEQSRVSVDGHDATPFLVRPDVEAAVSVVSRLPAVREAMVSVQREEAEAATSSSPDATSAPS